MGEYRNGVPAGSVNAKWVKSRKSTANGQCVELAALPEGKVAMRNSTDPGGPALIFKTSEIDAFLDGVKNGEFDLLAVAN
ncbi:putative toxin-antitoxin system, toxin component [Streptomyces himastatinicus ATCC 53653]|uniref:Putative toxin-antitoxin system, toxin component n=1 Tax=Streptomyces himastatinicus ATCC 53653 TaxID=457427 RepID=D9WBK1_9ACTN|nr:DUF397 domain-containing protein [Streptomyces himastatinicus]EFL24957.1 putative toxin-antitoxin system, toxin component [Streptomyces himastatinicus ATCC 53653]